MRGVRRAVGRVLVLGRRGVADEEAQDDVAEELGAADRRRVPEDAPAGPGPEGEVEVDGHGLDGRLVAAARPPRGREVVVGQAEAPAGDEHGDDHDVDEGEAAQVREEMPARPQGAAPARDDAARDRAELQVRPDAAEAAHDGREDVGLAVVELARRPEDVELAPDALAVVEERELAAQGPEGDAVARVAGDGEGRHELRVERRHGHGRERDDRTGPRRGEERRRQRRTPREVRGLVHRGAARTRKSATLHSPREVRGRVHRGCPSSEVRDAKCTFARCRHPLHLRREKVPVGLPPGWREFCSGGRAPPRGPWTTR